MAGWRSENAGVCKTLMRGFDSRSGLKMKVKAIVLAITIFIFLGVSVSKAQTFDFDKAYQDYQYTLTVYNQAYSDYQNAKNIYLANPTLSLKDDARQKTLIMLEDRDQLMVVYLTALRMKIVSLNGFSDSQKSGIFGRIDAEVSWYKNDITGYNSNYSLEDLFNRSSESESRYKTNTSMVVDESLIDITLGEEIGLRQDHETIYSNLKNIINQGVSSGKLTMSPFNHWLTDIDSTITTLKQNESSAQSQIQQIYNQSYAPDSTYQTTVNILGTSINPLIQLNQFLSEVLSYIRNQQ